MQVIRLEVLNILPKGETEMLLHYLITNS